MAFDDRFDGKEQLDATVRKFLEDNAEDIHEEGIIGGQGHEKGVGAASQSPLVRCLPWDTNKRLSNL